MNINRRDLSNFRKEKRRETVVGMCVVCFAVANFVWLIPRFVGRIGSPETYLPLLATSILLIVGLLQSLSAFLKKTNGKQSMTAAPSVKKSWANLMFAMGISFVYCFFLETFGFLALTPVCLVSTWLFFGVRKLKTIVLTTIILVIGIYLLFEFGLRAPLPKWHL